LKNALTVVCTRWSRRDGGKITMDINGNLTLDVIEAMRKKGSTFIATFMHGWWWRVGRFTDMKLSETTRIDLDAYRLSEACSLCLTALRTADARREQK